VPALEDVRRQTRPAEEHGQIAAHPHCRVDLDADELVEILPGTLPAREDLHCRCGQFLRPALEKYAEEVLFSGNRAVERRTRDAQAFCGAADRHRFVATLDEQIPDRLGNGVEIDVASRPAALAHPRDRYAIDGRLGKRHPALPIATRPARDVAVPDSQILVHIVSQ
jgi:hypothetical protein